MKLRVNGQEETLADGMTLQQLLIARGVNPNVVACEVNLTIIRRARLGETVLQDGDDVEILQMVGGG